jgi:uncharacterized membrane protein YbhN (UPF0104 family)
MTEGQESSSRFSAIAIVLDDALLWVANGSGKFRAYGFAAALLLFVAGFVWSIHQTPQFGFKAIAPLLILLLLSAPAGTLLNTVELHALSRIAGGPMSWRSSFDLTVVASAANMLPLPGGPLAKLAGMKAHGTGYGTASAMILLSFLLWGGLAFLYSGVAILLFGHTRIASLFFFFSFALLAGSVFAFARFGKWQFVSVVAATKLAYFILEALRYMFALMAIGASISFLQGSAFAIASFVASAIVVAPQGLGVNEAAAAAVSTIVGISAGLGFVAAGTIRIARLIGMAVIAAAFLLLDRTTFETLRRNQSGSRA